MYIVAGSIKTHTSIPPLYPFNTIIPRTEYTEYREYVQTYRLGLVNLSGNLHLWCGGADILCYIFIFITMLLLSFYLTIFIPFPSPPPLTIRDLKTAALADATFLSMCSSGPPRAYGLQY